MLVYCKNCGAIVESVTKHETIKHTEIPEPNTEYLEYEVCGDCGSDDIVEADNCPICGELKSEDMPCCDNCREEIEFQIKNVARALNITVGDLLDYCYEMFN